MVLHDQQLAGKVCRHGMDIFCLQAGDLVWRNKDPALEAQARASYESVSSSETRKVPVTAVVSGSIGQVRETASGSVSEMRLRGHRSGLGIIQSCPRTKHAPEAPSPRH